MKKIYLTKAERLQFSLPNELKDILVGLVLGDLCVQKQEKSVNVRLLFKQGFVHKDYLYHLFELFSNYCSMVPKITNMAPDKRTGKVYSSIHFNTYSLPCFNYLFELFYCDGKKIIPSNLEELLTPLGLAYFAMDDGHLMKDLGFKFSTDNFTIEHVKYLSSILNNKFNLDTVLHHNGGKEEQYRIYVPKSKLNELFTLIGPHIHHSMLYKIKQNS